VLRKHCLRILVLAVVSAAFPVCYLAAQDSQDTSSVADAAKRAREKKEAATKPANVITNDTIPSVPPTEATALNAPQAGTSSGDACSTCANSDKTGGAGDEKKNAEIEALKKELKDKQEAVNLLQRELSLDRDTYYSNPDYQRDLGGKQKLDDMQANLNDKQNELNDLKTKLTELAGADALKEPPKESAPANPPATPQQ
jgi:predicted RNase H-like nuclease (RuvC/YqgF family)